jgi:hypothetical protein
MGKDIKHLINDFRKLNKNIKLSRFSKKGLLEIIDIYEILSKRNPIKELSCLKTYENICNGETVKQLLTDIISSLLPLKEKKYRKKKETSDFVEYEYDNYIEINVTRRLNPKNLELLTSNIKKIPFLEAQI